MVREVREPSLLASPSRKTSATFMRQPVSRPISKLPLASSKLPRARATPPPPPRSVLADRLELNLPPSKGHSLSSKAETDNGRAVASGSSRDQSTPPRQIHKRPPTTTSLSQSEMSTLSASRSALHGASPVSKTRRFAALAELSSPDARARSPQPSIRAVRGQTPVLERGNETMIWDVAPPQMPSSSLFGDDSEDEQPLPSRRRGNGIVGPGRLLTPADSQEMFSRKRLTKGPATSPKPTAALSHSAASANKRRRTSGHATPTAADTGRTPMVVSTKAPRARQETPLAQMSRQTSAPPSATKVETEYWMRSLTPAQQSAFKGREVGYTGTPLQATPGPDPLLLRRKGYSNRRSSSVKATPASSKSATKTKKKPSAAKSTVKKSKTESGKKDASSFISSRQEDGDLVEYGDVYDAPDAESDGEDVANNTFAAVIDRRHASRIPSALGSAPPITANENEHESSPVRADERFLESPRKERTSTAPVAESSLRSLSRFFGSHSPDACNAKRPNGLPPSPPQTSQPAFEPDVAVEEPGYDFYDAPSSPGFSDGGSPLPDLEDTFRAASIAGSPPHSPALSEREIAQEPQGAATSEVPGLSVPAESEKDEDEAYSVRASTSRYATPAPLTQDALLSPPVSTKPTSTPSTHRQRIFSRGEIPTLQAAMDMYGHPTPRQQPPPHRDTTISQHSSPARALEKTAHEGPEYSNSVSDAESDNEHSDVSLRSQPEDVGPNLIGAELEDAPSARHGQYQPMAEANVRTAVHAAAVEELEEVDPEGDTMLVEEPELEMQENLDRAHHPSPGAEAALVVAPVAHDEELEDVDPEGDTVLIDEFDIVDGHAEADTTQEGNPITRAQSSSPFSLQTFQQVEPTQALSQRLSTSPAPAGRSVSPAPFLLRPATSPAPPLSHRPTPSPTPTPAPSSLRRPTSPALSTRFSRSSASPTPAWNDLPGTASDASDGEYECDASVHPVASEEVDVKEEQEDAPRRTGISEQDDGLYSVVQAAIGAGMAIDTGVSMETNAASSTPAPEPETNEAMELPLRTRRSMFAGITPVRPRTSTSSIFTISGSPLPQRERSPALLAPMSSDYDSREASPSSSAPRSPTREANPPESSPAPRASPSPARRRTPASTTMLSREVTPRPATQAHAPSPARDPTPARDATPTRDIAQARETTPKSETFSCRSLSREREPTPLREATCIFPRASSRESMSVRDGTRASEAAAPTPSRDRSTPAPAVSPIAREVSVPLRDTTPSVRESSPVMEMFSREITPAIEITPAPNSPVPPAFTPFDRETTPTPRSRRNSTRTPTQTPRLASPTTSSRQLTPARDASPWLTAARETTPRLSPARDATPRLSPTRAATPRQHTPAREVSPVRVSPLREASLVRDRTPLREATPTQATVAEPAPITASLKSPLDRALSPLPIRDATPARSPTPARDLSSSLPTPARDVSITERKASLTPEPTATREVTPACEATPVHLSTPHEPTPTPDTTLVCEAPLSPASKAEDGRSLRATPAREATPEAQLSTPLAASPRRSPRFSSPAKAAASPAKVTHPSPRKTPIAERRRSPRLSEVSLRPMSVAASPLKSVHLPNLTVSIASPATPSSLSPLKASRTSLLSSPIKELNINPSPAEVTVLPVTLNAPAGPECATDSEDEMADMTMEGSASMWDISATEIDATHFGDHDISEDWDVTHIRRRSMSRSVTPGPRSSAPAVEESMEMSDVTERQDITEMAETMKGGEEEEEEQVEESGEAGDEADGESADEDYEDYDDVPLNDDGKIMLCVVPRGIIKIEKEAEPQAENSQSVESPSCNSSSPVQGSLSPPERSEVSQTPAVPLPPPMPLLPPSTPALAARLPMLAELTSRSPKVLRRTGTAGVNNLENALRKQALSKASQSEEPAPPVAGPSRPPRTPTMSNLPAILAARAKLKSSRDVSNRSLHEELAAAEDESADDDVYNSVVEVSSLDPRAAARAAAILKMNHAYIEHGVLPDGTLDISRRGRSRANSVASRRSRAGTPGNTSAAFESLEASLMYSKEELLHEAELEIVGSHRRSRSLTRFTDNDTPLRIPGGWHKTPKRKRENSDEVDPTTTSSKGWTVVDWRRLDKIYKAEHVKFTSQRETRPMPGWSPWPRSKPTATEWDRMRVVNAFYAETGKPESERVGEWRPDVIALRVQALERKAARKAGTVEKDADEPAPKRTRVEPVPPSTIKRVVNWVFGLNQEAKRKDIEMGHDQETKKAKKETEMIPAIEEELPLHRMDETFDIGEVTMAQTPSRPVTLPAEARSRELHNEATRSRESRQDVVPTIPAQARREMAAPTIPPAPFATPAAPTYSYASSTLPSVDYRYGQSSSRLYPPLYPSLSDRSVSLSSLKSSTTSTSGAIPIISGTPRPQARIRSTDGGKQPLSQTSKKAGGVKDLVKSFEDNSKLDVSFESARREREKGTLAELRRVRSLRERMQEGSFGDVSHSSI